MPLIAPLVGEPYWVDIFMRIMIWSIAAISLDLVLGYGGMVSFGHAMFFGVGGYTIGILAHYEIVNGFIQWPLAIILSGAVAAIIGSLSIRTKGVYFIMITLAFGQMIYFLGVSTEEFGSDDGLNIYERSQFTLFGLSFNLNNPLLFYYFVFTLMVIIIWLVQSIVNSKFGMVIRGIKSN